MRSLVFGISDIAMVFVDGCEVGAAAFGTGKKSFRTLTVRDSITRP
jgi:hypothetical protein